MLEGKAGDVYIATWNFCLAETGGEKFIEEMGMAGVGPELNLYVETTVENVIHHQLVHIWAVSSIFIPCRTSFRMWVNLGEGVR